MNGLPILNEDPTLDSYYLSRVIGGEGRAVRMPFAEAPIDVDKPADLEMVEEILRRR